MHYSAQRGPSIRPSIWLSVRDVGGSGPYKSEILETTVTARTISPIRQLALRSPKATHLLAGEHGEIWGRLEVGWEKMALWSSGNISETCKDREKVTMGSL